MLFDISIIGGEGKVKTQQPAGPVLPMDVSRLDMRVGHIVSAKKHPDADGLYVEDVNLGEERNRVIISGLVKFIPLEQVSHTHARRHARTHAHMHTHIHTHTHTHAFLHHMQIVAVQS